MQTTWCELQFLLEGVKCYKDTHMKAYNITKVTAELKSSDSVQHRNKNHVILLDVLVPADVATGSTAI